MLFNTLSPGLPDRNKYHVTEVANFALQLIDLISKRQFIVNEDRIVQVRIGVNTGMSHHPELT